MSNKSHITKITVGRLFNLGNYEHVRYEVTVEIPDGQSAAAAVIGIERILEGLKPSPLCSCDSKDEIERKERQLAEDSVATDEDFHRRHGRYYEGTRDEYMSRMADGIREAKERRAVAVAKAKRAREMFDDVAGAETWTDAKLSWDDDLY